MREAIWLVGRCCGVWCEQMARARGGACLVLATLHKSHGFSPEGLATRRSIRINGNYSARERDEWAAGRETSSFVVVPACHRAPALSHTHTHTHTNKKARAHALTRARTDNRKALQLNNRPPVKQFFNLTRAPSRARTHTHTHTHTQASGSDGRSSSSLLFP